MRSVYIHIPFCKTICSYCDFCKFYYYKEWVLNYLNVLESEVDTYYKEDLVYTIYIGGGTPSALDIEEFERLFQIVNKFDLSKCVEFTFECNIENITLEKMKFLKEHGVNRLSVGVETFHDKYLNFLNRHHSVIEVKNKIEMMKQVGFDNINVDLIYALPNETVEEVSEDIQFFLKLDIPHISTYSLMIEPKTKLGIEHVEEIDEELDFEMYQEIDKILKQNGYLHYEISNFSKPNYESKHNLVYWNNDEYYGFGMGASGYVDGVRYDNTRNFHDYMNKCYRFESESLSLNEKIENEFILGFRKLDGISLKSFYDRYQKDFRKYPVIDRLLKEGKLVFVDGNIRISDEYVYVSNQILCQLIGENYE